MPLFSDHISNMYYSGSSPYTSSPYSYSSAASPFGSSYSASYLNPGGNYSSHSSIGSYSRVPLSSRWLTSGGRTYSPMLSTISEKGTSSPVRINSPRRIPILSRSYISSTYTPRPININTADIDVSRDKYRAKLETLKPTPTRLPPRRESPLTNKENGHDKPDIGIDTSPGPRQPTIKRDRAVVRLHTVKRKERDSPRKPVEVSNNASSNDLPNTEVLEKQTESKKWREKLADDLAYKTQKEKKTLGAKLVEKFTLKDKFENEYYISTVSPKTHTPEEISPVQLNDDHINCVNKAVDRRCSVELLAEQASLLDSLIRRENLSTAPLDLSKVGADDNLGTDISLKSEHTKKRKLSHQDNRLTTTKSDHSLHDRLSSKDNLACPKRRSLRKCSSGSNIRKLDCIKEIPKKSNIANLLAVQVNVDENKNLKPKIKTKITSTVEITSTSPQLKFIVENVTVEEKSRPLKKDIIFSSTVDENPLNEISTETAGRRKSIKLKKKLKPSVDFQVDSNMPNIDQNNRKEQQISNVNVELSKGHRKSVKSKIKDTSKSQLETSGNLTSPEPEDGNFWEKIGKRETIYLIKRKQNLEEAKEQGKRSFFWFPEDETVNVHEEDNEIETNSLSDKVINESSVQTIMEANKETIKNEENMGSNEHTNKFQEKTTPVISIDCKESSNTSTTNNIISSIVNDSIISRIDRKENIVNIERKEIGNENKTIPTPELTTSESKISKTSGSDKDKIDSHQDAEDIVKTKAILATSILNEIQSIKNSKNCKKFDVSDQDHNLKNETSIDIQHISLPEEEKLVNNIIKTSGIKEKNNSDHIILSTNLAEDSIVTDNLEQIPIQHNVDQKIISSKMERGRIAMISNKNNAEPFFENSTDDAFKNFNIPETKPIKSSIHNSSKKTNDVHQISEVDNKKAEKQDVVFTSSNSLKDVSVITETTTIENKKDDIVHTAKTDADILNLLVNQDKKIQAEESSKSIGEDSTSNGQRKSVETAETKTKPAITDKSIPSTDPFKVFTNVKPAKEEKALKPLIATPRPLQKRNAQTIRSSSSSESSDDDSSEDTGEDGDEDEGESGSSHGSAEYVECQNNPDGRTSTGSADSGFDSSAPASPSGFLHAKKGGDSPSTSAGATPPQTFTHDVLEQELELSTAYDLFRKTGRFTPPARTIPRFRKYTIEDFQFIRVLGKGSFGKVMLAELRGTEYYYAVKCLKKDVVLEDDDVECTLIERKVLALGTNHPYLCHLFATFQTDSHLFFVMEYLNGGDLMFHIQQSGRFPEVRARFYAAEIVSGLKFLHKRGIVYRDLKLDNILLDFDGHVRIADFGMCKLQIYLDKTADTFCGTPDYMAPEIIKGLKYNQTVDWWSFGVLLYEMLIGQSPFSGCDEDELFWSICNEMPSYPRFLSPESLSILTRLLDKDARTRLGGPECMHGDIRDQKFFEQIHWDRLERRELEAPFKPRVRHPMDTQYFDRAFTGERPRLTAVEPQVLRSMDQEPFRGFSYTNPNATDR